jgi:uncharacterized membrane protein YbhN (UPF0104 family)
MQIRSIQFLKNNKIISIAYKLTKIILPLALLYFLFKNSYISLQQIQILLTANKLKTFNILILSISLSFLLYLRWFLCIKIYNLKINFLRLIRVSSEAYSLASFIPGQFGTDLVRIGKLRKSDSTRFKTKLLKATLIEKIFALVGQLYILSTFLIKTFFLKIIFLFICIFALKLFLILSKKLQNNKYLYKYLKDLNQQNIFINFFYSIFCNLISCFLIFSIARGLNMQFQFETVAISSTLSNISSVIPISPNGLGLSEFIFSEVTQNISSLKNFESVATIYFAYRILLLSSHFLIFYISQILSIRKKKLYV